MRIRQRKAFYQLVEIIRHIEANPDDFNSVKELNLRVLGLVQHSEEAIVRHKQSRKELNFQLKTKRGNKLTSNAIRAKQKRIVSYIKAQRDQIYIWKCFGDALANIYLDPFSTKHAFFDTEEYEVKQDAGFTLGKSGLYQEVGCLLAALEHNVPAVLCDLTNSLRYGDVCLLGDSDPYFLEVKTNPKLNQRERRQQTKLNRLHDFMESDHADGFRGQKGSTIRVSIENKPIYHISALNECLAIAKKKGWALSSPEKGVVYIVIRNDGDVGAAFDQLDLKSPEIFDLNSSKNGHAWAPFLPFLLSIRDAEHALDFIEGRLYILVAIEPSHICEQIQEDGWTVRYRQGELFPIQYLHHETKAFGAMSSQIIARCAFDFMTLQSLVDIGKPKLEQIKHLTVANIDEPKIDEYRNRLIEFFGADDDWAKFILEPSHYGSLDN